MAGLAEKRNKKEKAVKKRKIINKNAKEKTRKTKHRYK